MATFGLILAGGRSTRFGVEKALANVGGKTFLEAGLGVLQAGCIELAINASRNSGAGRFAEMQGLTCLPDAPGAPAGPLAGVLAGLHWASNAKAQFLATVPCDTPFLPHDLLARLHAALPAQGCASVVRTSEGLQPLCALWRVSALAIVAAAIAAARHPPVHDVLASLQAGEAWFENAGDFANINTQAELDLAKQAYCDGNAKA